MRTATTSSASSGWSRPTTPGSRSASRPSPTSTRRDASSRASKAATTSARWPAASPRTCASWPACDGEKSGRGSAVGKAGTTEARPVIRRFDVQELDQLALDLTRPGAAAEFGILVVCLLAAWIVVRLMRGRTAPADSVWFGRHLVDGVLFPVLALLFAYAARVALETTIKPAVFRVAIPILISLVVIRLTVRVLTRTFPNVGWMRTIERSVSWLAWIAVVMWVTGMLPMVLDAMDDVRWKIGAAQVTLRSVVEGTVTAGIVIVLALWISGALERRLLMNVTGHDLSLRKIAATLIRTVLL